MNAFDESKVRRDAGGKFDEKQHSAPEAALGKSPEALAASDSDDFAELLRPTDADFEASFDTIKADIMNDSFPNGPNSWATVMGTRARRTARNIATFDEHIARVAGNDPEYREKHVKYATTHARLNSFARAYDQGIAIDPRAEAYFEENWANLNGAFGEAGTRRALKNNADSKTLLAVGALRPSAVVGTGYRNPRKAAEERLERREQEGLRALRTRGRSNTALANNALGRYYR